MTARPVEMTVRSNTRPGIAPVEAMAAALPIELTTMFKGYGPLPAVVAVEDQSGPWDRLGVSRRALLADGSSVREEITQFEPGASFSFEVTEITGMLGRLAESAAGTFRFLPGPEASTAVEWSYAFHPRPGRRLPVLGIAALWRRYMQRVLAIMIKQINEC